MESVNINNTFDVNLQPRYLTEDEIDLILENLPPTYGADPYEGEMIRQAIANDLREKFHAKKLTPSAINSISNQLVKYHNTSRIDAGSDVGSWAAEGSAHAPMQASLNSFQIAGSSRAAGGGFSTFEELFYTKKHREVEICTLHYKDKTLTYEEVLETKKDIIGCVFSDFIQDYTYVQQGDHYVKWIEIEMYQNLEKKWWHDETYITEVIDSVVPPDDAFVLRIHLNVKEMFKYKVSIQDLVDTFNRENETPIHLIYGPMEDAIIDIYACARYITNKKEEIKLEAVECDEIENTVENDMVNASFYQSIVVQSLNTLRVKGILGIRDLVPIVTPVVSIIQSDEKSFWLISPQPQLLTLFLLLSINVMKKDEYWLLSLPNYDDVEYYFDHLTKEDYGVLDPISYIDRVIKMDKKDNPKSKQTNLLKSYKQLQTMTLQKVYPVVLSYRRMKSSGITIDLLVKLFNMVGITVLYEGKVNQNPELIVTMPEENITPRGLVNKRIRADEVIQKADRSEYTELMKASEVIHSEVVGTNLRGLMGLTFLDQSLLMSNNLHVVASVLGIRASRAFFIKELSVAMSSFGLHPQHIITIADVFFCRGIPSGAMSSSVNKQMGPIDKASVSKAVEVFKGSALHGVNHDITGVSTSIAFGIAPKIGTGYMDIGYEVRPQKTVTRDAVFTAFKTERAYMDRYANNTVPVETQNVNDDVEEAIEKPKGPIGRKVNLQSKIPKKEEEEEEKEEEKVTAKIPVSKYQKKEEPKVPVSKYQKKEKEEVVVKKKPVKKVEPEITKKSKSKK